ncbi:hypothetical protein L1987_70434 [Smallanthus sonchifolius]|uniref:Uncharacterized protein n=1 Tax=Smallanthus sonchifolius TaxID=185202 RepID=A0ACB9AQH4_9ASTR|nr:hypothetical protein L1987_70434 [Smallanthus sonchifolius]
MQTYYLKVNINCNGCVRKVTKVLQRITGVLHVTIEAELGKVTIVGNVDTDLLIEKLRKNGKPASIWGAPRPNPQIEGGSRSKSTGLFGCLGCIRTSKGSGAGGGGGGAGGSGAGSAGGSSVRSGGKNAHKDEIVEEENDDDDD